MYDSQKADWETLERFAKIVAKELRIDEAQVTSEAYLDDLGMESLDLIGIIMELEREFHVCIPEKSILQTAQEVFGPGVLEKDGVLTEEGKALLRLRMPELDPKRLEGDVTVKDLNHLLSGVTTWVRMIQWLMEFTPRRCSQCGGEFAEPVALRMKCKGCDAEVDLPTGEELNRKWVEEHYQRVSLPPQSAAQSPAVS